MSSGLFGMIVYGANFIVGFLKWAALIYLLVRVVILGFKIMSSAKDGGEALDMVKKEGTALFVGLFIVLAAWTIQGALKTAANYIGKNSTSTTVTGTTSDTWN